MKRYYVSFVVGGQYKVNSFDTKKEAEHFASLVNGTIREDY